VANSFFSCPHETVKARLGSPLDAADDAPGTTDPVLTVTLARDGVDYLALSDAQDQGGPSHVYRLLVRAEK
jgi:hypothetical protein